MRQARTSRQGGWKLLSAVLPLCLSVCAGCDWPGKPKPEDRPIPPESVVDFDQLYSMHCAGCHGADGRKGPAPPHNDPLFLAIIPDAELRRVIREGRAGTPMPAFAIENGGPLTGKQVEVLAGGIKTRWEPVEKPKKQPPPYLLSEAKTGDRKAGRKVYDRACAECHGSTGKGTREVGGINNPAFLALISDQALRRYAITGRPDLGTPDLCMPAYDTRDDPTYKPMTSQEINDLVALLAYWRIGGSDNDR